MKKITFIGDIMCEKAVLDAAKQPDGNYRFDDLFEKTKEMFDRADYVVGNMEFPVAGEQATYGDSFFVFNAPDSFAEGIKAAGIDLVSTINNHTLDRGPEGIITTMKTLDRIGLPYTGTSLPERGRQPAYYFELDGVTFAVISYTYGINKKTEEESDVAQCLNRFARFGNRVCGVKIFPKPWVPEKFKDHPSVKAVKRFFKIPYLPIQIDTLINEEYAQYIQQFSEDVAEAKKKADFVIAYLHTGGQFNIQIGDFSKYVFEKARQAGADAVLASHSHVVQKAEFCDEILSAYGLGNFNMVPNSFVTAKKPFPEYGLAMHLYMDGKSLDHVTFSLTKAVRNGKKQLSVWPVDALYNSLKTAGRRKKLEKEVREVYAIVTGRAIEGDVIRQEYELR